MKVLVDPWVASEPASATDAYNQAKALERAIDLLVRGPTFGVEVLPFLRGDELFLYGEASRASSNPAQRRRIERLNRLIRHDGIEAAAVIVDALPGLPESWREVFACATQGSWRDPVVAVPASRLDAWPPSWVGFRHDDGRQLGQLEQPAERRVTMLERLGGAGGCDAPSTDGGICTDWNPWLLGGEQAVKMHPRELPRPPNLNPYTTPMEDWQDHFALVGICPGSGTPSARACYRPPRDWDPVTISAAEWRDGRIFPVADSSHGKGFQDRDGYVWCWDLHRHEHWDVQFPDGKYMNVEITGALKRCKNNTWGE